MSTNDTSPDMTSGYTTPRVDLDDMQGTHTIDDGHPCSYDHEATVIVALDRTVTVTCSCVDWERTSPVRFGDEGDTEALAAWESHVYAATGRAQQQPEAVAHDEDEERCPCGVPTQDGNPWCSYEHYLEYDLAGEADDLRAERDRLLDDNARLRTVNARLAARVVELGGF